MLVLDVILVYEVLNRLWELRHDSARDSTSHDSNVDQRQQEPEQHQQPQEQQDQEPEQQQAPQEQQREEEHTTPALTPAEEGPKALDWWHVLCCCRSRSSAKVHPAQSAPVPAPTGAAAGSPSGGGGQRGNQADISGAAGSSSAPGDGDAEAALEAASNTLGDFAIAKTAGAIHAALLRLALDEASTLITDIRRRNLIATSVGAGTMLEDIKAAAVFLSSARERFCEAVTTGKVFGEYAAEGITQLRAVQRGEMPEGGSILLRSIPSQRGQAVKAKLFKVDAETTNAMSKEVLDRLAGGGAAAGPPDRDWQAVLESQPKCMAVTSSKLEQCSRDPVQLFLVKKGGELAAALCLCKQHGTGYQDEALLMQPLANGYTAESTIPRPGGVYAPPLEELNFTTLGGAAAGGGGGGADGTGAAAGGGGGAGGGSGGGAGGALPFDNCRAVFRMTVEQLRRVRDGGGTSAWDALCKRLWSSADIKHSCARCEAPQPKSIWADTSGAPGAPSYRMLVVCGDCRKGKHLKDKPVCWVELHYSSKNFTPEQKNVAWTHFSRLWGGADVGGGGGADGGGGGGADGGGRGGADGGSNSSGAAGSSNGATGSCGPSGSGGASGDRPSGSGVAVASGVLGTAARQPLPPVKAPASGRQ
ncbi:hypothetical protein CHLRE_09g400300v5 [Chlamydomonas reinhardtii]|uniref:Uncharacterized protein n=1 Tax=Chlamydomonas reinhardtii TaxID=3055 RepID=A0A2K3DCV9_CHLRE|nr:uncharacterized protein CHLRE_09g400300v5 [Chlamydomonas reinhardtii]PNW78363.1 hypothetical protein CHLRE_09g400300v5 [Chlamydomonas reinhardtii]